MLIDVFGTRLELIRSTSPVPGKWAASVQGNGNSVIPDLFLWDPMVASVQYDEARLTEWLEAVQRSRLGLAALLLGVTDALIWAVKGARRLFGGSYGGSLGFGGLGALVAVMSAVLLTVATLAAALVLAPLSFAAWLLRKRLLTQVMSEKEKVLIQASEFFEQLSVSTKLRGIGS
jgi:hypothetical protein